MPKPRTDLLGFEPTDGLLELMDRIVGIVRFERACAGLGHLP
jgi:hypothetical protein